MNFLNLFAAGKSLVGMKDQNCPYRMRSENLLPKFESAKNPFAAREKAAVAKAETSPKRWGSATAEMPPVAPAAVQPAIMETRPLFGSESPAAPVPAAVPTPVSTAIIISVTAEKTEMPEPVEIKIANPAPVSAPQPVKPSLLEITPKPVVAKVEKKAAVGRAGILSGWLKLINPFGFLPRRVRNQPKPGRSAIQTELSLERIKVIRNDLHDTDLEIVAPKTDGKPPAPPSRLQTMAKTEAAALGRMTAKFFGAHETQVR